MRTTILWLLGIMVFGFGAVLLVSLVVPSRLPADLAPSEGALTAQPALNAQRAFSNNQICRAAIGALYDRAPADIKGRTLMDSTVRVSYIVDGQEQASKCRVDGQRIQWGEADEQWRQHDRNEDVTYKVQNGVLVIEISHRGRTATSRHYRRADFRERVPTADSSVPKPENSPSAWHLATGTGAMDDSQVVELTLDAMNTYNDWLTRSHRPTLVLICRSNKTEVYIDNGSPANPELGKFQKVTIRLRFDDASPITLIASESTDSEALFFPSPIAQIRRMLRAERMRYEFTPFRSSSKVVEFDLRGLSNEIAPLQETCNWK